MMSAVQVQNVSFSYRAGQPVLREISFTVPAGIFLAVVGPNGVGKSTLINLIAGSLAPQSGAVSIDGIDLQSYQPRELARKIAIVRQEFVPAFGFTVAEMVLMARTACYGPLGFESRTDRKKVMEALEMTETARFAARPLASLSGGERQRVFIARALAQDTPILLMDEPTSFLDLKHQVGIYDLLKTIQSERSRTIIAITHDINLATQYCDQALLLHPPTRPPDRAADHEGPPPCQYRIGPTRAVLTADQIAEVFGVRMFAGRIGNEHFFVPLGRMAKDAFGDDPSRKTPSSDH